MALLWKMICNLGDPMSLRHPVTGCVTFIHWACSTNKYVPFRILSIIHITHLRQHVIHRIRSTNRRSSFIHSICLLIIMCLFLCYPLQTPSRNSSHSSAYITYILIYSRLLFVCYPIPVRI